MVIARTRGTVVKLKTQYFNERNITLGHCLFGQLSGAEIYFEIDSFDTSSKCCTCAEKQVAVVSPVDIQATDKLERKAVIVTNHAKKYLSGTTMLITGTSLTVAITVAHHIANLCVYTLNNFCFKQNVKNQHPHKN